MTHIKYPIKITCFFVVLMHSILLSACGGGSEGEEILISEIIIFVPDGHKSPLIDQTFQLTATGIYSNSSANEEITSKVRWQSDKPEVASISKTGEVTTIATGEFNITATYAGISQRIKLTIIPPPTIESVNILTIDEGYNLSEDSPLPLTAESTLSNDEISLDNSLYDWASSDEDIATVDENGNISGINHGEVTITAVAKENSEISAEITATVKAKLIGISPNNEITYVELGEKANFIVHEDLSDGTSNPIPSLVGNSWDYDIPDIARITATGEIKATDLGSVIATVQYEVSKDKKFTLTHQIVVESPIELFVLEDTGGLIKLAWNAKHDASSYTLYWNNSGDKEEYNIIEFDDPDTLEYIHADIDTTKPYYYRLAFTRNEKEFKSNDETIVWPHIGQWQFRDVLEPRIFAAGASYKDNMYLFGGELTKLIDPDEPIKGTEQVITNEVWEYNIIKNTWTRVDSLESPLRNTTACSNNESIFIIGGEDETGTVTNTVHLYNSTQSKWSYNITAAPVALSNVSCDIIGDIIYISGGLDGIEAVNTTYSYDIANKIWNADPLPTLNTARYNHASVVVDEKIYIAGGSTLTDDASKQLEVFDPAAETLTWTSLKSMDISRSSFALHTWNGSLHAIGGEDIDNEILNNIESYDPIENSWQSNSTMPFPNSAFNSTLYNDAIYIFGGTKNTPESSHEYSDYMKYSINDGTWLHGTNPSAARAEFSAVTLQDKLYLLGGTDFAGATTDIRSYDTKNNSWEKLNSLLVPRQRASSAAYNHELKPRIYTLGGINGGVHLKSIEVYNISESSSELLPNSMQIGRANAAVAILDTNIYVFGGDSSESSQSFEIFDTTRMSWSIPGKLPNKRSHATAVALNNKIYLIGGKVGEHDDKKASNTIDIYTPATNSWDETPGSTLNVARALAGSAILNGKIYVFGGLDTNNRPTNTVESLAPFTRTPNAKPLWKTEDSLPRTSTTVLGGSFESKIYLISEEGDKSKQLFNNIFVLE